METKPTVLKIALALALTQVSVAAGIYTTGTTEDAFVTAGAAGQNSTGAGNPAANYGGAGVLMISGAATDKGEMEVLFKFNLAATRSQLDADFGIGKWTINTIKLQLGTNFGDAGEQPNNAIFNKIAGGLFKVDWLANDAWHEGTGNPGSNTIPANPPLDGVTYNTAGPLRSAADKFLGSFTYLPVGDSSSAVPPPAATYALTLDGGFLADIAGGGDVSLYAYPGDNSVGYLFNSKTYGTVANRPLLVINATAIPEPGTAGYLACALVGVGFRRARHASRA